MLFRSNDGVGQQSLRPSRRRHTRPQADTIPRQGLRIQVFSPQLTQINVLLAQLEAPDEEDAGLRLPDLAMLDFGSAYGIAVTTSGQRELGYDEKLIAAIAQVICTRGAATSSVSLATRGQPKANPPSAIDS